MGQQTQGFSNLQAVVLNWHQIRVTGTFNSNADGSYVVNFGGITSGSINVSPGQPFTFTGTISQLGEVTLTAPATNDSASVVANCSVCSFIGSSISCQVTQNLNGSWNYFIQGQIAAPFSLPADTPDVNAVVMVSVGMIEHAIPIQVPSLLPISFANNVSFDFRMPIPESNHIDLNYTDPFSRTCGISIVFN